MKQSFPVGGFRWIIPTIDEVLSTPDDADEGFIVEAETEYPESLHDLHNDYPLAPETISIKEEWLSQYQRYLLDELECKLTDGVKLVPNLHTKKKFVLHYRNLKLYKELSMRVTKIHRAIKFKQQAWMASYIDMNTPLRMQTTSDFEKNFFKLANNAVFGKTIENLRKRIIVDLVSASQENRFQRLIADTAYISHKIFSGDLVAVHSTKSKRKLNLCCF